MNDLLTPALAIAAVKFKWQKDEKTYDYLIPAGLELEPGDKVVVETKRGETEVEVVAIKAESEMAAKPVLRRVEPVAEQPQPKEDWNF
jgi:primosomal protein N'